MRRRDAWMGDVGEGSCTRVVRASRKTGAIPFHSRDGRIELRLPSAIHLLIARTAPGDDGILDRLIQVVVNNGDRTFTDESDSRMVGLTAGIWIYRMVPIDFNGDGATDFVIQHEFVDYPELIFINDGSGAFTAPNHQAIANKTGMLFPVDADGDGDLDFIVHNKVYPRADFDFSLLVHN